MNIYIIVLPLFLLLSCASKTRYPAEDFGSQYLTFDDKYSGRRSTTVVWANVPELAEKYLKSGRINRNDSSSCFKEGGSVNFIEIDIAYVHLFRPYVTEVRKSVSYTQRMGFHNGKFGGVQTEKTDDHLDIKQKICFKDITLNNHTEYVAVVSEVYSAKEGL